MSNQQPKKRNYTDRHLSAKGTLAELKEVMPVVHERAFPHAYIGITNREGKKELRTVGHNPFIVHQFAEVPGRDELIPLNTVSDRFSNVSNLDLVQIISDVAIAKGYDPEEVKADWYWHDFGTKVFGRAKFMQDTVDIGDGKPLIHVMNFSNGCNGKTPLMFQWGLERLVCTNGMTVPVKGQGSVEVAKHTGTKPADLVDVVRSQMGVLDEGLNEFRRWLNTPIDIRELIANNSTFVEGVRDIVGERQYEATILQMQHDAVEGGVQGQVTNAYDLYHVLTYKTSRLKTLERQMKATNDATSLIENLVHAIA